eukprot:793181-Rhodomonas_salina.2
MGLRACYVMSGTDVPYVAIGRHACYAMSGTDVAYGVISLATPLRACYAMSGTEIAYGDAARRGIARTIGGRTLRIFAYRPTQSLGAVRY